MQICAQKCIEKNSKKCNEQEVVLMKSKDSVMKMLDNCTY